jgi:hypothetical protein
LSPANPEDIEIERIKPYLYKASAIDAYGNKVDAYGDNSNKAKDNLIKALKKMAKFKEEAHAPKWS